MIGLKKGEINKLCVSNKYVKHKIEEYERDKKER